MQSPLSKLAGAAAAFALCISPTMAVAATSSPVQPISPLIAVSLFGTRASAQEACGTASAAMASAGAIVAQGQAGCVLPATDAPLPAIDSPPPAALPPSGNYGINWLLLGLGVAALLGGLSTLFDDDDDDDSAISPA